MFSYTVTVQLEYINHLLQFFKNIFYYAGIIFNAFSDLLCSKLCWHNRLATTLGHYGMLLLAMQALANTVLRGQFKTSKRSYIATNLK